MFKAVDKKDGKIGVLDTSDGVIEYYSYSDLVDIKDDYGIVIGNMYRSMCCTSSNNGSGSCLKYSVIIYNDEDLLFDGKYFKLVVDYKSESVHLVVDNVSVRCIWISDKVNGAVSCDEYKKSVSRRSLNAGINNIRTLISHCKRASEINESFFIDLGNRNILEFYSDLDSDNLFVFYSD